MLRDKNNFEKCSKNIPKKKCVVSRSYFDPPHSVCSLSQEEADKDKSLLMTLMALWGVHSTCVVYSKQKKELNTLEALRAAFELLIIHLILSFHL